MKFTSSGYLTKVYNDPIEFGKLVQKVTASIQVLQENLGFEALAFTGQSGSAMAYAVSAITGIPLICVRKTTDGSHATRLVEGPAGIDISKYLIMDDFTASGDTVRRIIESISTPGNMYYSQDEVAKCVGAFMYLKEGHQKEEIGDIKIYHMESPECHYGIQLSLHDLLRDGTYREWTGRS